MAALFRNLLNDESGVILSAEVVIILTIGVIGMVVGLSTLQNAILSEFYDLSLAFQSLNQSYSTPSYRGCWKWWGGRTSWVMGSRFIDVFDGCVGFGAVGYNGCEIGSMDNYSYGSNVIGADLGCQTSPAVPNATAPATTQPVPQGTTLTPPGVPCQGCK